MTDAELSSILLGSASMTTKLIAALWAQGRGWGEIEPCLNNASRSTIHRARRDLGNTIPELKPRQYCVTSDTNECVTDDTDCVGGDTINVSPVTPNARAPHPTPQLREEREVFEPDVVDLNTPPVDLLQRSEYYWSRLTDEHYSIATIQQLANTHQLTVVVDTMRQLTERTGDKIGRLSRYLPTVLKNSKASPSTGRPTTTTGAESKLLSALRQKGIE